MLVNTLRLKNPSMIASRFEFVLVSRIFVIILVLEGDISEMCLKIELDFMQFLEIQKLMLITKLWICQTEIPSETHICMSVGLIDDNSEIWLNIDLHCSFTRFVRLGLKPSCFCRESSTANMHCTRACLCHSLFSRPLCWCRLEAIIDSNNTSFLDCWCWYIYLSVHWFYPMLIRVLFVLYGFNLELMTRD